MKKPLAIFIIFFVIVISAFCHKAIFSKQVLIPTPLLKLCYPWKAGEEIKKVNTWGGDGIFEMYPFKVYTSRSIKEKEIPKWNPYIFCGTPFLANLNATFFAPFNMLDFFIISPAYSFTAKVVLTIFLSCLFMAMLVLKLTGNRFAALLSGLIYGFNGFSIFALHVPILFDFMLWLPCLFLILVRDVERHSYLYGIIAGLIISVQILNGAGCGNLLFYTIVAVLVFGLYFSIIKKREFRFFSSPLFTALFSVSLGILLSAVQLLPSIEFAKYCQRPEISFSLAPLYSLPATLLTSLFPDFFGDPTQNSLWGYYLYRYLFNIPLSGGCLFAYAGVLPIFLVLLVIGRKTDNRYYNFFGWLTIVAFFFSHLYPLFIPILRVVPLLNKFHNHERALWMYIFSLSVLAGIGLSSLSRKEISLIRLNRIKKGLVVILIVSIILTGVVNIVIGVMGEKLIGMGKDYVKKYYGTDRFSRSYNYSLAYYDRLVGDIIPTRIKNSFSFKSFPYWRSIICLLATLGIFILYSANNGRNRTKLGWLCVTVLLIDLFSYGVNKPVYVRADTVYPITPAIELLQKKSRGNYGRIIGLWQQELFMKVYESARKLFVSEVLPSASSVIFKLYDARGYASLYTQDYRDFYKTFYPSSSFFSADAFTLFPSFNQRLFDLLSVRYVLTAPSFKLSGDNLNLIYDSEIRIYENRNALPRVFLVPEIRNVRNGEEARKILASPDFNPHHLAIVMGCDSVPIFKAQSILDSDTSIIDFQINKVTIEAHMKSDGPLVLTDTYFPGWKAFIDGKETRIYRANYIHRMIIVPKGKYLIKFIYDPLSFNIGAIISIVTFMGCCIFVLVRYIRHNVKRGTSYG